MTKYLLSSAFVLILFTGCLDFPIYKEKSKDWTTTLSCIKVIAIEDKDIAIANHYLKISKTCDYKLVLEPHLIHKCHNPKVKSIGSDIDGYVRLELYKADKLLFRSQKDFKGDDYSSHLKTLLADFINIDEVVNVKR